MVCRVASELPTPTSTPSRRRHVHTQTNVPKSTLFHNTKKTSGGFKAAPDQLAHLKAAAKTIPGRWDASIRRTVEEEAIAKALAGDWQTMDACSSFYLQEKDYVGLINIFERYAAACDRTDNRPEAQDINAERRVCSFLCAITAHVMAGSFEDMLRIYLKTGCVQFSYHLRDAHLQALNADSVTANRIRAYITDLTSAYFVSKPDALSRYIQSLSKTASSRSLTNLYQGVLDGITRPKPFIAACPSHNSNLPLTVTEPVWASFIAAFAKAHRPDLSEKIMADLKRLKVKPGIVVWTSILDGYRMQRLSGSALEAWRDMQAEGVKPDAFAYRSLIDCLFRDKQPRLALERFGEFQTVEKTFDPSVSLTVYNAVIAGLLKTSFLPQAEHVLGYMKANGPLPDVVTYNTFLDHHSRKKNFDGLVKVMDEMEAAGISGDVYTFSTLLHAFLSAGRKNAVDLVLNCMAEQGVQANHAIYTAMINHQLSFKDEGHLRAAFLLLDEMESNPHLQPNNITYTSFLTHLFKDDWLDPWARDQYRGSIILRMKKRNVMFSLPDYHILLRACFDDQGPTSLQRALGYYQEIKARNIPMVGATYYIMLAGLIQRGAWMEAKEVVRDIEASGFEPAYTLRKFIDKVYSHL